MTIQQCKEAIDQFDSDTNIVFRGNRNQMYLPVIKYESVQNTIYVDLLLDPNRHARSTKKESRANDET